MSEQEYDANEQVVEAYRKCIATMVPIQYKPRRCADWIMAKYLVSMHVYNFDQLEYDISFDKPKIEALIAIWVQSEIEEQEGTY